MATHISIEPGRLYPQPGFTVQVDKEGKWTATQIFLCHRLSAVTLLPRPGSAHPEIGFIECSNASVNFTEGDVAEITCQYAGCEDKPADKEKANASFTMGLSLSEEPLLSHRRYKNLGTTEKEALKQITQGKDKDDQGNKLRDKVTSLRGKEALTKIERGQTNYYSPRVTWRERWVRNRGVEAAELYKVGCIDTPEGPAPALGSLRDWLRNGVQQTQEGKAFTLELEWLASNPGGWDTDLYVVITEYPCFNTVELDAALHIGLAGSELSEITLMGEITWKTDVGTDMSTRTFSVVVENDVVRGSEGEPQSVQSPPFTTGLTAVTGDISVDAANGTFQMVTLTGSTMGRVLNVPANGRVGMRFELWIHSTTGNARSLNFHASILKPSTGGPSLPIALVQGATHVVVLRHNGTNWTLGDVTDELGFTTVGRAIASVANPSAIRFLRVNADNTVSLLSDADMLTALGAAPKLVRKTSSFTAAAGYDYKTEGTAITVIEPAGSAGDSYTVTVVTGYAMVGTDTYYPSALTIIRYYDSSVSSWKTLVSPSALVRTSSFTASVGGNYKTTGTYISVYDPTGSSPGDSYTVMVLSGYISISGTYYYASAIPVVRYYDTTSYSWKTLSAPGAWTNKSSSFTADVGGNYKTTGTSISVYDPSGASTGDSYTVLVLSGSIYINGTYYYSSAVPVVRYYDTNSYMWKTLTAPGAWTNKSSSFTASVGGAYMIDGNSMPSISDPSGATSGDTWCFMVPKGSAYVMGSSVTHYASTKVITRRYDGSNWRYGTENSDPAYESSSYLSLSLSHVDRYVLLQYSGSTTIYVPSDTSTYWPDGTEIRFRICQSGYTHSFSLGSGVTVNNSSALSSLVQHDEFRLRKISYNTWNFCKY